MTPHELLHSRINYVVMFIKNLSINKVLCNGTRLSILELSQNVIKCLILTREKIGNVVF